MSNRFPSQMLARFSGVIAALALILLPARASINLFPPGQNWNAGTDGVFAPTSSIEVDLSQAVTGTWDQDNTANTGKGSTTRPNGPSSSSIHPSTSPPASRSPSGTTHPARRSSGW